MTASCEKKESSADDQQLIRFDIPTQQSTADYRQAYLDFLKDKQASHVSFALIYIDNDEIPELYLSGVCEAEGDMVCSFKNGVVVYRYLGRTHGGKYIERSGKLINQNGHMGNYYDNVYQLNKNGFSEILNASYTERYEDPGNGEYNVIREYLIGGTTVSEAEYNHAVSSAFDLSRAVRLDEGAVSYTEMIQLLQNGSDDGK